MNIRNNTFIVSEKIEIIEKYDIVVVGGRPAGISAAITAGRNNLKTLFIE